ncbi:MAG: hypothetical protein IJU81_03400 [Bacteroidales bacterium]|nr:hypothetical protein [Bacteroidales bacterium]
MKKHIILFSLLAVCTLSNAQHFIEYYLPGPGEQRFGFSLVSQFWPQNLSVSQFSAVNSMVPRDYTASGTINNFMGYGFGLFYGIETDNGGMIDIGSSSSLFYSAAPFHGDFTINTGGAPQKHTLDYRSNVIIIDAAVYVPIRFSDEFSISLGFGVNGKLLDLATNFILDGQPINGAFNSKSKNYNDNGSYVNLALNAGTQYWFADNWFVGARVYYNFMSFRRINAFMFKEDVNNGTNYGNYDGLVSVEKDGSVYSCIVGDNKKIFATVSIGFKW